VPQRTCSSRCWRCCEVRGRGGAEQSRSRRDGCSAGLSAAQKQAGRRLRGLTETGEACTARSAVREGTLRVHRPMSVSALERRWQFTARPQAIGWISGMLELLRGRDGATEKQQRCSVDRQCQMGLICPPVECRRWQDSCVEAAGALLCLERG
jgi:hypothetical protein